MAEKNKSKESKPEEKRFTVGLQSIYRFPRGKRPRKAITFLRRFIFKHLRVSEENVMLSNRLNELLWQRGRGHVPRKIGIKVIVDKGKANVFLEGEKAAVPKEEKKEEKKVEEKKTPEQIEAEKRLEEKKKEKKMIEKAAEAAAMKRGT